MGYSTTNRLLGADALLVSWDDALKMSFLLAILQLACGSPFNLYGGELWNKYAG
jgi:hypothetical protein